MERGTGMNALNGTSLSSGLRIDGRRGVAMPRTTGTIEVGLVYHALNQGNSRRWARHALPADRGEHVITSDFSFPGSRVCVWLGVAMIAGSCGCQTRNGQTPKPTMVAVVLDWGEESLFLELAGGGDGRKFRMIVREEKRGGRQSYIGQVKDAVRGGVVLTAEVPSPGTTTPRTEMDVTIDSSIDFELDNGTESARVADADTGRLISEGKRRLALRRGRYHLRVTGNAPTSSQPSG